MDGAELKKKHNDLTRYARLRGFKTNQADDFASEALIKIMEGRKATHKQLFTDYLRENFITRAGRNNTPLPFQHDNGDERYQSKKEHLSLEVEQALTRFKPRDRAIFVLTHIWGFNQEEIGFLFGFTQSYTCMILSDIEKFLAKTSKSA